MKSISKLWDVFSSLMYVTFESSEGEKKVRTEKIF